jgi:hypothetical protein
MDGGPQPVRVTKGTTTPPPPTRGRSPAPRADSKISVQSACTTGTKEYMDSLVPPTPQEFDRISHVQEEREEEHRRRSKELKRQSVEHRRKPSDHSSAGSQHHDAARAKAARVIQRTYRGYRARREMQGFGLDASTRWVSAIREAQYRELIRPRARSVLSGDGEEGAVMRPPGLDGEESSRPSTAKGNWKKATMIARRAGHDDLDEDASSLTSTSSSDEENPGKKEEARKRREEADERRRKDARMMGLQYFLEMVDLKHRYGSNLRIYHEEWKKSDTNENFFYWLDCGGGRNIEMDACPRDRLEREQVRYLSREERQYYLVTVDNEGRLCWAKNNVRIDTTEKYKDSIHGVVPADDTTEAWVPSSLVDLPLVQDSVQETSDSSAESEREADRAAKYATPDFDEATGIKKVSHLSASTIFNKLLRKSVKKNTWIFVADTSFRLYVGIKNSGAFQHSSFLQGGRISAAGLIKIKNGRLHSLSPLSGHYRPPASNFRAFVKSLREAGVDMSHVSISKSYAVLVGLEVYVKTRKKGKKALSKIMHRRDKLLAPQEVKRKEEEERDKSQSAEKERKYLEKERQREEEEREENRASVKLLQMLHISPTEPAGQRGGGDHEGAQVTR